MTITTAFSTNQHTGALLDDVIAQLDASGNDFDAIVGYFNIDHDASAIHQRLSTHFACPFMLASSCNGAFALNASGGEASAGISLFGITDPQGNYGIGRASVDDSDPGAAAADALNSALAQSELLFETPSMVWTIMPPGNEEELLKGFASVIGPNVPVFGGSSADNDVSGNWCQITREGVEQDAVIALVMLPSQPIGSSYSSGYHPTDIKLTAADCNGRTVHKLNGNSAANEYNKHTAQSIEHALNGGNVLGDTTLHPLGKLIASPAGVPEYLLCHPDAVTEEGGLSLFSVVDENQEFLLMEGSIEGLVNRAAAVIQNAIQLLPEDKTPSGVLMIYCAGCMLTVDDNLPQMQRAVSELVGDLPVVGAYTFGEQGCFLDGKNRHGNLMISAVVFSQ